MFGTCYNGVVYIGSSEDGRVAHVYALSTKGGAFLWSRQFQERNGPELAVNDAVIYASAGNALFALRADNGALLWTHRIDNTISLEASNIAGGFLYTLGDNGYVYALRADNGHIIWQKRYGSNDIPILAVDNGIVYVAAMAPPNDTLDALRSGDGSTLWSKSLNGL